MAETVTCPHCERTDVSKRHPTLCGKNPNRVKSTGRPKREPEDAKAPETGGLSIIEDPVNPEQAPRFEAVTPDQPAGLPPTPGLAPPTMDVGAIVDVACMMVDQKFEEFTTGSNKGPPGPPERIKPEEKEQLKNAANQALMAYPQIMTPAVAKWLPLVNLTLVLAAVIVPRIIQGRAYIAYQAAAGARREAAPEPTTTPKTKEPDLTDVGDAMIRAQNARLAALNQG